MSSEAIDKVIERYKCASWIRRRTDEYHDDARIIADHACEVLPKVREALESAKRWTGKDPDKRFMCDIHAELKAALALLDGKVGD